MSRRKLMDWPAGQDDPDLTIIVAWTRRDTIADMTLSLPMVDDPDEMPRLYAIKERDDD